MTAAVAMTFLVTGVGSGLGRAVAVAAARAGHTVVGTVRREEDQMVGESGAPGREYTRLLDVTDEKAVRAVVDEVERDIAPIDVLVTNVGYGQEGLVEESSLADLRRQFELTVFGSVAVIQAVLPFMRARRRGHIIAVTSMGTPGSPPGLGFYHGSRAALEAIMDALGQEVAGLGIRVTAVDPGTFRTDWSGRSMVRAPRSIPDYDPLFADEPATWEAGAQLVGSPDQAGRAILDLVTAPDPPTRLLLAPTERQSLDDELRTWLE
jgi:NAD(P)-dependent dehydrogenase (short-subunit alcohol dehydrogenase family)